MTRKAIFSMGLVVAMATAATAAERTRMGTMGTDSAAAGPAPAVQMVEPNVAVVDFNGSEVTIRANGAIVLDEVSKDHGSLGEYQRDVLLKDVLMARADDGTRVYANGVVAMLPEMIPTSEPAAMYTWTLEDAKESMLWGEREIGGQTVLAFASGVILNTEEVNWHPTVGSQSSSIAMPQSVGPDGLAIYADGRVVIDEQPLADPSGN